MWYRHRTPTSSCANLLLFLCVISFVYCFNLEVRIPVVKSGNKDTYFGYSVAEHKDSSNTSWLLVGAPLGRNLQPGTTRSGALYKCPLTTYTNDCQQVITDGRRSDTSDELYPPGSGEDKEDQWLGVSVSSGSTDAVAGDVAVCAHRYVLKTGDRLGQGLCYSLTSDFRVGLTFEPCKGKAVDNPHEQYGFCQAGTSSALYENTLLLGAPGPLTWAGDIYVMDTELSFLARDKLKYHGPEGANGPVPKYSYLGMSVTAGHFYERDTLTYAAGAPRSHNTGQVVLYRKVFRENPMEVLLTLDGEQFASSFGYEITAADINGDGWSDLLVGAPFYFTKSNGGAVYLYRNSGGDLPREYSARLPGPVLESRFGFAIASLGDINRDGCDDIAIGAPYEGSGAVYIYLGSWDGLLEKPAQVIRASTSGVISTPTFGYSLSGGLDMDRNGYPDLLVGAYASDSIVLLRARPIIDIKTEIMSDGNEWNDVDPSKPGCRENSRTNYTCFSFETCATIDAQFSNVWLRYRLVAETFQPTHKFSRVWFNAPNDAVRKNVVEKLVALRNGRHCEKHTLYLKENTRDILNPIKFQLSYQLLQNDTSMPLPGAPLPSIDEHPILNHTQAEKVFEASFFKDCGDDSVCTSVLRLDAALILKKDELLLGEHSDFRLHVKLENHGEPAYEPNLYVHHHASLDYVSSKVRQNEKVNCNFHNATVVACTLGNPFKRGQQVELLLRFGPKNVLDHVHELPFTVFANSTSQVVAPEPRRVLAAKVVRKAKISLRSSAKPEQVFFGGVPRGESAVQYRDDVGSQVVHAYEVYNEGPWRSDDLIVEIMWPHQDANSRDQGKWLLYLVDVTLDSPEKGWCDIDEVYLNPLKLAQRENAEASMEQLLDSRNHTRHKRRVRREAEPPARSEAVVAEDDRRMNVHTMDCDNGGAKCIRLICNIKPLLNLGQAVIRISARLWNATLVEDYSEKGQINIVSQATVKRSNSTAEIATASATTKAYPDLLEQLENPFTLWIIIASVLIGLLLLIILTVILWKCGFFERRRPDHTLSGNIEKHHEGSPFLERK